MSREAIIRGRRAPAQIKQVSPPPPDARCSGHRTSGYWKNYPCGARPVVVRKGRYWCKNHVPL